MQLEFETNYEGINYLVGYESDSPGRNTIESINLSVYKAGTIPVDVEQLPNYQPKLWQHIFHAMENNAFSYYADKKEYA